MALLCAWSLSCWEHTHTHTTSGVNLTDQPQPTKECCACLFLLGGGHQDLLGFALQWGRVHPAGARVGHRRGKAWSHRRLEEEEGSVASNVREAHLAFYVVRDARPVLDPV